jgi:sugar phosphate permease
LLTLMPALPIARSGFGRAVTRRPRLVAGLWFAVFGFAGSALMYLMPVLSRSSSAAVLYLLWPTVSALAAGALIGPRVSASPSCGRAAVRGIGVMLLAFAIFAPLFTASYAVLDRGSQSPVALTLAVFLLGILITAPVTLVAGAVAGCALFRLARPPA